MKAYWDPSALVHCLVEPSLQQRLKNEKGFTRPHALAEVFSTLTGNPQTRIDATHAADFIAFLSRSLEFVDLTIAEILQALRLARQKGVRGGRVHGYLHAWAAQKCNAEKIITLDRYDFTDLTALPVEQV